MICITMEYGIYDKSWQLSSIFNAKIRILISKWNTEMQIIFIFKCTTFVNVIKNIRSTFSVVQQLRAERLWFNSSLSHGCLLCDFRIVTTSQACCYEYKIASGCLMHTTLCSREKIILISRKFLKMFPLSEVWCLGLQETTFSFWLPGCGTP